MPAIGFDEALRTILASVQPLPAENVTLAHALGVSRRHQLLPMKTQCRFQGPRWMVTRCVQVNVL